MNTLDLMKSRRDEILAIAAKHGAANIRIFGSVVRGEDRDDSDVDVLVDMADDRSLYDLVGLQQDIESLLGRKADVLTTDSLHPRLKDRILAEALPL